MIVSCVYITRARELIKHDIPLATKQCWTNQNSAERIRMLLVSFCLQALDLSKAEHVMRCFKHNFPDF